MSLYIFGDIHFSSLQPWRLPLGDAFLAWFESLQVPKGSSALFLGDYCDGALLPGNEIAQLNKLADISADKFDTVYLLVGNHDLKLIKDVPQLSFEFLGQKDNITILREPAEILNIQGLRILSLPHYNYRSDLPPMHEYYKDLPQSIRDQQYDIIVGHFSDASAMTFGNLVDLSYLKASHVVLGHEHIRSSSHYTGSIFPCKISENISPKPRAIWVFEKTANSSVIKKELELPCFGEYKVAEYPKPLPSSNATIPIYTILGCETEKVARDFYGKDIFIRGVTLSFTKKDNDIVVSDDTFVLGNPTDVFNEWIKTVRTPISRPVAALARKMLIPPDIANPSLPTN